MTIVLYHVPASFPCRTVRLVAAAIDLDLNLKLCDLMNGEQNTPEFLKMNPQHAVPTLDDNGFYLAESYHHYNTTPVQSDLEKLNNGLEFLDKFLEGEDYVAGKQLTVADIFIACTLSTLPILNHDFGKYKNIVRWFSKMKSEIPKYEEINESGLEAYKQLLNSIRSNKK